jgi:5-methylcytosine-specific restriction endonuclease McrA
MKERDRIKAKFGGKCAYCGEVLSDKGWHVDHKVPIGRNRKHIPSHYRHKVTKVKISYNELPHQWWKEHEHIEGKMVPDGCSRPENDTFENKIPACASCNINKHGMSIEEFRQLIEGFINSLNLRMVQYKIAKRYGLIKETGNKVVFYFETFKQQTNETKTK